MSVTTGHYRLRFYLSVVDESVEALVLPLFWADDCRWESTAVSPLALVRGHGGGPVGVSTLALAVGEEPTTVEEVCEPYLIRAGMIARTPRGRVATAEAWKHQGLEPPEGAIGAFF